MAGVKGRSGGGNRTMSTTIKLAGENAPSSKGLAKADWYIYREQKTREEIYEALANKLNDLGLTDIHDGTIVSMLASLYEVLQDAQKAYDTDGPAALIGRALASRIMIDCQKEIRVLLGEFYMTPSTRSKRPAVEGEPDSIMKLMEFKH